MHAGCLWIGEPIHITDMLINRITNLPYKGADPTEEFVGNNKEKDLSNKMKNKFWLIKKSRGYSIHSIEDQAVQLPLKF